MTTLSVLLASTAWSVCILKPQYIGLIWFKYRFRYVIIILIIIIIIIIIIYVIIIIITITNDPCFPFNHEWKHQTF